MRKLKRFALTLGTAVMVMGSAVTALAAAPYFYVYEDGVFGEARMGQECVDYVEADGDDVLMYLQDASYGPYSGRITNAFVDEDGDKEYDEDEQLLYVEDDNVIAYDQSQLETTVEGDSYANFCIVVTIFDSTDAPIYEHKPQSVYVPMQ